jgi:hypothetical protein
MELRTAFPLEKGDYEGTANYDHPGQPPTFWTQQRRNALPLDAQRECAFYYQNGTTANSLSAKSLLRKRNRVMGRPRVSPPVASALPRSAAAAATPFAPPGSSGPRKRPAEPPVSSKKNETPTLPPGQRLLGHDLSLTNQPPVDPVRPASYVPPAPPKVKVRPKLLPGQRLLGHGLRLEPQDVQPPSKL